MRKIFWCCLAAGAAGCCALGAVAYVWQNPDSPLAGCVQAVGRLSGRAGPAPLPGQPAAVVNADDLIPPAPTPADEPDPPAPPAPGSRLPPAVAALIPPIVIHEEDDLSASRAPGDKGSATVAGHIDAERPAKTVVDAESVSRRSDAVEPAVQAPIMPHCADDEAPQMPHCADDGDDGKVGATYPPFDPCAFWMAFFSAPTRLFPDPAPRPYTGRACMPDEPAAEKPLRVDPKALFDHPRRLPMPQAAEPQSDTMEMRPSDWKPYSLDPGPF